MASTTSTEQSGLFKHLLPEAKKALGFEVRVVAVGTGQALDMGRRGDADVVFVHDKVAEEKFLAEGFGVKRFEVMYNDFIIVGPEVRSRQGEGQATWSMALKKIAATQVAVRLARRQERHARGGAALLEGRGHRHPRAHWYRETGSGMGPTLNTASGMNAYALTDRGTWLSFKNRGDLVILVEGDVKLFNQYGVMLVNPAKHAAREEGDGPEVHRLADLARGAGRDRRLQDRRRAALLPQLQAVTCARWLRSR